MRHCVERARAIASDRQRGASALLAELLPVLAEAVAEGRDATIAVARIVCRGQPAMASLWNLCASALADFAMPGTFAQRRAEFARAKSTLPRAAHLALRDALQAQQGITILTMSYSGSVMDAITRLNSDIAVRVICGESLPGGEGVALRNAFRAAHVEAEVVADALLTTFLREADAVIVGADAVGARRWANKAGTFGITAAAWFAGIPTYVVATSDKGMADALDTAMAARAPFEWIPAQLLTLCIGDRGPLTPESLPAFARRYSADVPYLIDILK